MRTPVASLSKKILSTVFAAALTFGLMPAAAFAVEDDDTVITIPAGEMINQVEPLEVVAQQESTKSYFLAQTLEDTRTVPVVSANLPLDTGAIDDIVVSDENTADDGVEKLEQESAVAMESMVVGSFEQDGIIYAIEPGGDSVAVVSVDYSKLAKVFVETQVIVIPESVTPDGIDYFSVTRIADNAFASLKNANANPDYVGCEALLSDERILAEAGIESTDLIEDDPLAGCAGILALSVPAGITVIEDDAFAGFETLQYIVVSEDNPEYASYDGALYSADLTNLRLIPEGRVGAVCVASSAVEVDPEVFSHCPLAESSIADADSMDSQLFAENGSAVSLVIEAVMRKKVLSGANIYCESTTDTSEDLLVLESVSSYAATSYVVTYDHSKSTSAKMRYETRVYKSDGSFTTTMFETVTLTANQGVNATSIWANKDNVLLFTNATKTPSGSGTYTQVRITPSRSGYYCNGWTFGGKTYNNETVPLKAGTISPVWVGNSYTITWNSQGGSTVKSTTFTYSDTGKVTLPTAPTRTGYLFKGWYSSASGGTKVTSSTALPAKNSTYYAQWLKSTPMSYFYSNTGSIVRNTVSSTGSYTQITSYPATAEEPYDPIPVVTSLCLASSRIEMVGTYKTNFAEDKYLIGVNKINDTTVAGVESAWVVGTDIDGNKIGWELDSTVTDVTSYEHVDIYLNRCSMFDITWNANGGECAVEKTEDVMPYDTTVEFPVPTREGYTFKGWYTTSDGESKVTSVQGASATYYALWVKNTPYAHFISPTGAAASWIQNLSTSSGVGSVNSHVATFEEPYTPLGVASTIKLAAGMIELVGTRTDTLYTNKYGIGIEQTGDKAVGGVQSAWLVGTDASGNKTGVALDSNEMNVVGYEDVDVFLNGAGSFSISFDSNGGNESVQTVSNVMPYGPWTAPSATRSGYVITGWYDGPDDNAKPVCSANGAGPALAGATTLFAHWAPVLSVSVPLTVSTLVDLVDIAEQTPVLDKDGYQGYIESHSGGTLEVAQVDFEPFEGAERMFGDDKSRVFLEARVQSSTSASPDLRFSLDAEASEADATKLAPFTITGLNARKAITYRFAIPKDVLLSIDSSAFQGTTTPIGRVAYTVAISEQS